MKTCANCGQPMQDDTLFCGFCGGSAEEAQPTLDDGGFCPSCGQPLEAESVFCPGCGANLTGEAPAAGAQTPGAPSVPKKPVSHRTVGLISVAAAAVALVALVVVVTSVLGGSPAQKFVKYQRAFLLDQGLSLVDASAEQWNKMSSFSTDMTLTAQVDNSELNRYLEDTSVSLNVDMTGQSLLANAGLDLDGSRVLSGMLSYDKGVIGLSLPELDDTYYTADWAKLAENMGMDENLPALSGLTTPELSSDTLNKLCKRYFDVLAGAVNKENVKVSENKSYRLQELGEKVKCTLYTFEPKAEDIEEMLLKLADAMEKDQDLRSFAASLVEGNEALLEELIGTDLVDEVDARLADIADDLRYNAEDIGIALEDAGFRWILAVDGKRIYMQRIEVQNGNNILCYESLGDVKSEREDLFYVSSYGEMDGSVKLTSSKDGKLYDGKVVLTDGYHNPLVSVNFSDLNLADKSALGLCRGDYRVRVSDSDMSLALEVVKGSNGGTDHILSMSGMGSYTSYSAYPLNRLDLTLHTSDKKSSAARPKGSVEDVSDYDIYDFNDLTQRLSTTLYQDVLSQFPQY